MEPVAPVLPVDPVDPVYPVAPVSPVEPVAPVDPADPVFPVDPVAPAGPAGPGTGTVTTAGAVTTVGFSHALNANAIVIAENKIEYFIRIPFDSLIKTIGPNRFSDTRSCSSTVRQIRQPVRCADAHSPASTWAGTDGGRCDSNASPDLLLLYALNYRIHGEFGQTTSGRAGGRPVRVTVLLANRDRHDSTPHAPQAVRLANLRRVRF